MVKLLREKGTMELVNLTIEKSHVQEYEEGLEGGWHTQGSLMLLPGWTEYQTQSKAFLLDGINTYSR